MSADTGRAGTWTARLFAEADRQRDVLGRAYEEREKAGDSNEASLLNDFMGVLDDLFLRCGGTGELDNTQFVSPGNFITDSKPCPGCPDCQSASLSASSDTGGAGADRLPAQRKIGGGLTRFGLYVDSLRWAIGFIDKRHHFGDERPVNGGDEEDDWMEHAAALDLLKDADDASTQLSVSPDPEEVPECHGCEKWGPRPAHSLGSQAGPYDKGQKPCQNCVAFVKENCRCEGCSEARDTGEEPGREGGEDRG